MIGASFPVFRTTSTDRDRAAAAGLYTAAQWKAFGRAVVAASEPQGWLDPGASEPRVALYREDQTVEVARRMARRTDA